MLDVNADGSPRYEDALKVAAGRHDLSVIKVHDPREESIPAVGLVNVKDSETGETMWVNTDSRSVRRSYEEWNSQAAAKQRKLLMKYKIDNVDIATDQDYVKALMALFNNK